MSAPWRVVELIVGVAYLVMIHPGPDIVDWWRRRTRGEFHCPTCGHVSALPRDDDDKGGA